MNLKSQFLLNPEITYLNFGSFGACPKPVFDEYIAKQRELESEPVQFIAVNGPAYLKQSKQALANYINCDSEDLIFTPNPTAAINIIANSLDLKESDEVLSTDLEYGALDRTWNFYCEKKKAKFVRQHINFPVTSKEEIIEQFWKGYSSRTKAIFISQVTSTTAMILPVKEICEMAKAKGLLTIVDGAHVPGHLPLDLSQLKADIYTGACHKWMLTPKGCSFLYVKRELQEQLDPLIVSWGYKSDFPSSSRFHDYHQFNGTRDFSAYLTVPVAIEFMNQNNWKQVSAECRKIVKDNASSFCELLGTATLCPITDEFLGQMFSIPVKTDSPQKLQAELFSKYKIEIPVMHQNGNYFLRYSLNAYNSQADLDHLAKSLEQIIATTDLIHSNAKQSVI